MHLRPPVCLQHLAGVVALIALAAACSDDADPVSSDKVAVDVTSTPSCWCDPAKDTPCATNRCDAEGNCSMVPRPKGTPCDDGNPCSIGDRCASGSCTAGTVSGCECQQSADCKTDGDACTGTFFCDKAVLPWSCRIKPGTKVVCAASNDACTEAGCDSKTGKCTITNKPTGTLCDDGNSCTEKDRCTSAKGGKAQCTGIDTCSCSVDADCTDDTLCSAEFCDKNTKKCRINPALTVKCPTDKNTACLKAACIPSTGLCEMTAAAANTACDDGDKCTTGDICKGGACKGGTNTCSCKTTADCSKLDDGNTCNGLMFCNKSSGTCEPNPASIVTCPTVTDTACALNVCQPKTGKCAATAREKVTLQCTKGQAGSGTGGALVCKWILKVEGQQGARGRPGPVPVQRQRPMHKRGGVYRQDVQGVGRDVQVPDERRLRKSGRWRPLQRRFLLRQVAQSARLQAKQSVGGLLHQEERPGVPREHMRSEDGQMWAQA